MPDTIRKVNYYYTTAPDKPGEGARLLQALRNAGVNLLAFHAFPSARKSQADFRGRRRPRRCARERDGAAGQREDQCHRGERRLRRNGPVRGDFLGEAARRC